MPVHEIEIRTSRIRAIALVAPLWMWCCNGSDGSHAPQSDHEGQPVRQPELDDRDLIDNGEPNPVADAAQQGIQTSLDANAAHPPTYFDGDASMETAISNGPTMHTWRVDASFDATSAFVDAASGPGPCGGCPADTICALVDGFRYRCLDQVVACLAARACDCLINSAQCTRCREGDASLLCGCDTSQEDAGCARPRFAALEKGNSPLAHSFTAEDD